MHVKVFGFLFYQSWAMCREWENIYIQFSCKCVHVRSIVIAEDLKCFVFISLCNCAWTFYSLRIVQMYYLLLCFLVMKIFICFNSFSFSLLFFCRIYIYSFSYVQMMVSDIIWIIIFVFFCPISWLIHSLFFLCCLLDPIFTICSVLFSFDFFSSYQRIHTRPPESHDWVLWPGVKMREKK